MYFTRFCSIKSVCFPKAFIVDSANYAIDIILENFPSIFMFSNILLVQQFIFLVRKIQFLFKISMKMAKMRAQSASMRFAEQQNRTVAAHLPFLRHNLAVGEHLMLMRGHRRRHNDMDNFQRRSMHQERCHLHFCMLRHRNANEQRPQFCHVLEAFDAILQIAVHIKCVANVNAFGVGVREQRFQIDRRHDGLVIVLDVVVLVGVRHIAGHLIEAGGKVGDNAADAREQLDDIGVLATEVDLGVREAVEVLDLGQEVWVGGRFNVDDVRIGADMMVSELLELFGRGDAQSIAKR